MNKINTVRLRFFVIVSLCSYLVACSLLPFGSAANSIVKSDKDDREYEYITLSNQLRVMLISDPNAERAAAALDVYVGSGQDPEDRQGLAHFLEHMLFLGTAKYPNAGEYQSFIAAHSGGHNAYTSFEHTNYFFDIAPSHLDEALDRFSQFFIAPLFDETYVEREKNAVHSEYMAKIKDDQRRALDVFKRVVNPRHPFAKFSVGNLDTLSSRERGDLRKQLLSFYEKYYSANIMTMVVLGREPLNELREMVEPKFTQIPNRHVVLPPVIEPLFPSGSLPLELAIQPEKEQRLLSIVFPTPSVSEFYLEKPMSYIGNIIGHEGEGSLLSFLKSQGWAEGLSAGAGLSYRGGSTFNIMIRLSKKGVDNKNEIIKAVFQTINRIREEGDQRWLFEEQKAISEQQFRYLEPSSPSGTVSHLANDMHYYPAQDTLRGPYMMADYNYAVVDRFLTALRPGNSLITLNAPELYVDEQTDLYAVPFKQGKASVDQLAVWDKAGLNADIKLPEPNEFIARRFSIVAGGDAPTPRLVIDKNDLKLWFKTDGHFETPKASIYLSARSPIANDSIEHSTMLHLYTRLLTDRLNEYTYPAALAGLHYSLSPSARGLTIKINGFNDKQSVLLDKILEVIGQSSFESGRFENIRQEFIRQMDNAAKQQPYRLLMSNLPEILYRKQYSEQAFLTALQSVSLEQVEEYAKAFKSEVVLNILVYGNYSEGRAGKIEKAVRSVFAGKVSPRALPEVEIMALAEGEASFRAESSYSDSAVLLYLQSAVIDKSSRAAMGVTSQILRSDFYTQLRTEKQLGYIVTSGAYPSYDVPGLFFIVQSPVVGAEELKIEFDDFLRRRLASLSSLDESSFNLHRQALIQRLSEDPENLREQAELFWQDIVYQYDHFDSRQQLIAAISMLTFDQWRSHFKETIGDASRRSMWLYTVGGATDSSPLSSSEIDDISLFKRDQTYFSFE